MNLDTAPAVATADLPPTPVPCLDPQPGLILLGRDERGRPHASAFGPDEAPAAERAATLMGFATLTVVEEHQGLASSLPKGRIFESGRAFVPFCSTQTFARLLEAAGLPDAPAPARAAAKPLSRLRPRLAVRVVGRLPEALAGLPSRPSTGQTSPSAALCSPGATTRTATTPRPWRPRRRTTTSS